MAAINKKVCTVAARVYYCLQVDKWSNQNEKIRINNHCPSGYRLRRVIGGDGVMSDKLKAVISVLIAIITIVTMVAAYSEYSSCSEDGGRLVRGLFWLECIK